MSGTSGNDDVWEDGCTESGEQGGQPEEPWQPGRRSRKRTKAGVYTSGKFTPGRGVSWPLAGRALRCLSLWRRRRPPSRRPRSRRQPCFRYTRHMPMLFACPPPADVTLEDLSAHFHRPASKACQELGMGVSCGGGQHLWYGCPVAPGASAHKVVGGGACQPSLSGCGGARGSLLPTSRVELPAKLGCPAQPLPEA